MAVQISRRDLLRRSAALASLGAAQSLLPSWMPRLSFAPKYQATRGDVLVCVFLRGGADTLNVVVPHGDEAYYAARPKLAIARPDDNTSAGKTLDLDGFFGLHPALAPLLPIFSGGDMAAIHATGSPDPTRSHFEAMDFMERGTPGAHDVASGWIARHLSTLDTGNRSPIRALGWGPGVQASLRGPISAVAMQSIVDYHLGGNQAMADTLLASLNAIYAQDTDLLKSSAETTSATIDLVRHISAASYQPKNGAVYPQTDFGSALLQTAALMRADIGLETACIDVGGWDTHVNQGGAQGQQAVLLTTLADGLAAFHTDLGPEMSRLSLIVMSEFGRRVYENGGGGTDHGHGGAMLVMSGNLAQGPVVAHWPGLASETLVNGDLAITTDYRQVLSELVSTRLHNPGLADVFPGFTPGASLGLFKA